MTRPWWQDAVGYEVYVRSFADSDGDGVGDLPGLRSRLPYLAELGVDLVWLTPIYPSPQADHGYDVSDHLGVQDEYGTLADVEGLLADAHALGLRVVVDLVPNHTSDRHPWFRDARASRRSDRRDWYVWRDPAPDGGPPNNWLSVFGGPAWTFDDASGQYYMHLFLPEQPDLNWANEEVRDAFDGIVTTWLERGVDGLRIDVAHALVEDPKFRDNPLRSGGPPPVGASPSNAYAAYDHRYDIDQPAVIDIYRRWHRIAVAHDALLLGEVYLLDPDRVARYVADGDGLHAAFFFPALKTGWDADELRSVLVAGVAAGGHRFAWPLSSHDDPRAPTRFGGGERGARRALGYLTLLCGLPGLTFLYQGDELGLDDADIDVTADPIAVRHAGVAGRDPMRTPMPWAPGPGLGFTTGRPWLPLGRNRSDASTVAVQAGDPASPLERTRALLTSRRRLRDLDGGPTPTWLTATGPVVAYRRGDVVVALHVGDGTATLDLPQDGRTVYATTDGVRVEDRRLHLPVDAAAVVALDPAARRPRG